MSKSFFNFREKAGLVEQVGLEEANEEFNIDEAIEEALAESIMLEDTMNEEWDETQMALGQLRFIEYACDEIAEYLEDDVEDMPEWFQNKLTMAFAQIQALHSYAEGDRNDDDEDEDEDEDEMEESVTPVDQDKLAKIREMLAKEKK